MATYVGDVGDVDGSLLPGVRRISPREIRNVGPREDLRLSVDADAVPVDAQETS